MDQVAVPAPCSALLAGLCGGAVLDVLEALTPRLSSLEGDLAEETATLLTDGDAVRSATRRLVPLGMGAVFGVGYAAAWRRGLGNSSTASALMLGAAHGLLTASVAPAARRLRPQTFDLPAPARWIAGEVLDHAAYALTTALVYRTLTGSR